MIMLLLNTGIAPNMKLPINSFSLTKLFTDISTTYGQIPHVSTTVKFPDISKLSTQEVTSDLNQVFAGKILTKYCRYSQDNRSPAPVKYTAIITDCSFPRRNSMNSVGHFVKFHDNSLSSPSWRCR